MKYRTKERTQATTSLLGFGCMRFPVHKDGSINEEETFKMLDLAYQRGVNYFDTAYLYHEGTSETVVGNWLKTKKRDSLYLVTKNPVWLAHNYDEFDYYLNEQLNRLQTDYFDFYLLHALDQDRWNNIKKMNLIDHLDDVKASGKAKRIGFSFHDDFALFEEIIHSYPWDFCQIQLNYMDVDYQAGLKGLELAESLGIPVVVMEPIKGGQLANVPDVIKTVFRGIHPDWSDASWALRWVASHENVYTVLSGMSTMEQVNDNLNTFDEFSPLNEEEFSAIAQAKALFDARIQVPCTGCRYCMPCPFGVDIPRNFKLWNRAHVYNLFDSCKESYGNMDKAQAAYCQKCGACIAQCPQHIEIPNRLEQVKKEFSDQ